VEEEKAQSVEAPDSAPRKSAKIETKADHKVLTEKKTPKYTLRLELHHRGLELVGYIFPKQKGDNIKIQNVLDIFKELNITGEIDQEALRHFCGGANYGNAKEDIVLARGIDAIKGKDERIDFKVRPTSKEPRYEKDSHGNIDYYNLHLFDNVMPGQVIGVIMPPEPGIPGKSVTGEEIPGQIGLPFERQPKAGDHVKLVSDGEGKRFVSKIPGRVVYESETISVTDIYDVNEEVGFNVGNIDFVGEVNIRGDVLNEFNIKAGKDLYIKGNVGTCRIEAAGDFEVEGVSGGGRGSIKCGGNMKARYLNDVTVECKKNILVKNEIVNCKIKCGGFIDVNMGAIMGGKTQALAGIEARALGSEIGVKTQLISGVCYIAEEKIANLRKELDPVTRDIEKISKKLDPFLKNPKAMLALTETDRQKVRKLAQMVNELLALQEKLKAEIKEIQEDAKKRSNAMINVRHTLERGVEITLDGVKQHILAKQLRQMSIVSNSRKRNTLRFMDLHPLTEKGWIIERDIARREEEEERKAEKDAARNQAREEAS
jgi:uncharacterized protein (DUF342 family)